jgi:hypothetical protein
MKKTVVILAVLIAAASGPRPVSAAVDFDLGLKAGLSLAQISFTGDVSYGDLSLLARPVFGAFFAYHITPMFSVQPEIYYLTQGSVRKQTLDDTEKKTEQILSYIDIPVLAKARFKASGRIRPVVFAGPAVSFMTKAVQRFYTDDVLDGEYDLKPFLKSTNFSAVFGGGVEYSLEKIFLVFDLRYDLGFGDIDTASETVSMKTRALLVMVGAGF